MRWFSSDQVSTLRRTSTATIRPVRLPVRDPGPPGSGAAPPRCLRAVMSMQIPDIRSGVPLGSYVAWPRALIQRRSRRQHDPVLVREGVWLATAASMRCSASRRSSGWITPATTRSWPRGSRDRGRTGGRAPRTTRACRCPRPSPDPGTAEACASLRRFSLARKASSAASAHDVAGQSPQADHSARVIEDRARGLLQHDLTPVVAPQIAVVATYAGC